MAQDFGARSLEGQMVSKAQDVIRMHQEMFISPVGQVQPQVSLHRGHHKRYMEVILETYLLPNSTVMEVVYGLLI